ncbi:HD domain-containing protein [Niveibacterium sp. SC-1]|uniref:HD domain-containing protein n=1 Tax=Niveibacterium sp. SC-1 TaxID=3135646 RepID=UPI00311FAFAD
MTTRLEQQLAFILEIDKLKGVLRQSLISDGSRRENSAEHSWQIALMALLLAEHADEPVDAARAATMLLIHDIVEIDAGDAFLYDEAAQAAKASLEQKAATRLFGLLPQEQATRLHSLWEEFEAGETPDARYARAMDRLMPMMLNVATEGRAWRTNGVTADKVLARNAVIAESSQALWDYAEAMIGQAVTRGLIPAKGAAL